ncbi:SPOR domain-containing protein [Marinilabiliaceae bacterium JC017]|nr:SPOR domain-containing protein [Marinilabiliaceae bacterium JC017]
MDKAIAPYFSIQIIALKLPPGEPSFFKNVDVAREYPCDDGYVRYCMGQYNSFNEARKDISRIKALGYEQAFVVDSRKFRIDGVGGYGSGKIDPNKTYTIQLSAFRFPVYLTHFKGIDNVMEFRMKDKIFRYTIGSYKGTIAKQELDKIKAKGYKDAFLVEFERYLPFKIE